MDAPDLSNTKTIAITFSKEEKLKDIKIDKYNSDPPDSEELKDVKTKGSNRRVITYWGSGNIREEYFVNENIIKNGPYESFYDNGEQFVKCTYVDGKKVGPYESLYSNGQQKVRCTYSISDKSDENGKRNGLYEAWYKNGQQEIKCTYVDGKKNGPYESLYSNGQQKVKCTYSISDKSDRGEIINGIYENFNPDGTIEERCFYREGKKYNLTLVN